MALTSAVADNLPSPVLPNSRTARGLAPGHGRTDAEFAAAALGCGAGLRSAALDEAADRGHELVGAVGLKLAVRGQDALAGVAVEEAERDLLQRGLGG